MLESRSAYGYYGERGGYTGEDSRMNGKQFVRLPYREYKTKWSDHKTAPGSYDPETKTIEVLFTAEEMKEKTNLGNRYHMQSFYFRLIGVEKGISPACEFTAKTEANAIKNAKKWARDFGYTLGEQITFGEYMTLCGR